MDPVSLYLAIKNHVKPINIIVKIIEKIQNIYGLSVGIPVVRFIPKELVMNDPTVNANIHIINIISTNNKSLRYISNRNDTYIYIKRRKKLFGRA